MFVPALGRIVRGMESWWSPIDSPDQLKDITDADIDAQPAVQALRALAEQQLVGEAADAE